MRTTFGPRQAGLMTAVSPSNDSVAESVPPAASRPLPAITPLMNVRRGKAAGASDGFGKWSVIRSCRLSARAHRTDRVGAPDYNTRCTAVLLQKTLALSAR